MNSKVWALAALVLLLVCANILYLHPSVDAVPTVGVTNHRVDNSSSPTELASRVSVVYYTVCNAENIQLLKDFIGYFQNWEPSKTLLVFAAGFDEDQLAETRLYLNTVVMPLQGSGDVAQLKQLAQEATSGLFSTSVYLPVSRPLRKRLCRLDQAAQAGKTPVLADCSNAVAPPQVCFNLNDYTQTVYPSSGLCFLRMRRLNLTVSQPPLPRSDNRPYWCLGVATYSRNTAARPSDLPLFRHFLPSFIDSIRQSHPNFRFAVYIATQVDPSWDNPASREMLIQALNEKLVPLNIVSKIFRYPLGKGLRDIVWKYNQVLQQAYVDGCDYLYQWSDDTEFRSEGWPETLAKYFDSLDGFGTAGMTDLRNPPVMTLGASGRKHMEIQGNFWPPNLKNIYADSHIEYVYGNMSNHMKSLEYYNTQAQGQRYSECSPERRANEEYSRARYRAYKYFQDKDPARAQYLLSLLHASQAELLKEKLEPFQQPDAECPGQEANDWTGIEKLGQHEDICKQHTYFC